VRERPTAQGTASLHHKEHNAWGIMDNGERLYFLDNLRTFLIFLVILYHAGVVYESSGLTASFWIVDDPSTSNLLVYAY
jgi:hypothetical protein